jgi:hypothetical protein
MSTLDFLVLALSENGTRVSLTVSGSLRLSGTPVSPALLADVKAHKSELVTALREARALAKELYHSGDTETFAAELNGATARGDLAVTDWCAADLALTLARRWAHGGLEQAA